MIIKNFNFNHRIILYKENQQEGNFGEITYNFEKIKEVWAKITPININQNFSKMKQETEISHIIEIRYFKEAKECKKIIFGKREFFVLGVICKNEDYEYLTFNVREIL